MPERQSDATDRAARGRRTRGVARRQADRHAAAVVAEEIRRLSRSWRPDGLRTTSGRRRGGEGARPKEAF